MPPASGCPNTGPPSPEVTGAICRVPSTSFSQAPGYTQPVHLCRFRVRSMLWELFPGCPSLPVQSDKDRQFTAIVTTHRLRNINLIPIVYGFRPRLRGRLTLGGLALPRNPWTYGERVSHPLCRYSCQHSHFRYLQVASQLPFTGLRNAPLPLQRTETRGQRPEVHSWPKGLAGLLGSEQSLQHHCDFPVFAPPILPALVINVAKIATIACPNTHLVG